MEDTIRNWHFITWAVLAIWMLLFAWGNWPFLHQHPKDNPIRDLRGYSTNPNDRSIETNYEFTGISGWPIECIRTLYPSERISSFEAVGFLLNLAIFFSIAASFIYMFQKCWNRISLGAMFVITTICACLFATLPYAFAKLELTGFHATMRVIYLAPILLAVLLVIFRHLRRTKSAG